MSSVTYSPEDNKLRLYVGRVPRDEFEALRAAGFTSTPKQSCDFVATWTPAREDLARQYLEDDEDIGDEDYSPEERAADRAERFAGYRDKRADEAGAAADTFEQGPAAFGSQNLARAQRQARRHDRHRVYAVSQWSKAEYWQGRTAGVIANALHKSSPSVRRGRILTLEAEQRKHLASLAESQARYDAWASLTTMDGADQLLPLNEDGFGLAGDLSPAQVLAYTLANHGNCWSKMWHPTCEAANEKNREIHKTYGDGFSPYDLLTKSEYQGLPFDRLTPKQVAGLYVATYTNPSNPGTYSQRWARHYELRLEYEKAMLANEGGMVGESEIEPGGWIRGVRTRSCLTDAPGGWLQVQRVHRSPATKRVTSVEVWGTVSGFTAESGYREHKTTPALVNVNIERLGQGCYRPPTDEEREAFKIATKQAKAEAKATKPKLPSLINPTLEDAQQLQALWNAQALAKHEKQYGKNCTYTKCEPSEVLELTQGQYSANSGGSYSHCETRTLYADGRLSRRSSNMWTSDGARYDASLPAAVCKVRVRAASGFYAAPRVIVITDKPSKPLPLDWDALTGTEATPAELVEA